MIRYLSNNLTTLYLCCNNLNIFQSILYFFKYFKYLRYALRHCQVQYWRTMSLSWWIRCVQMAVPAHFVCLYSLGRQAYRANKKNKESAAFNLDNPKNKQTKCTFLVAGVQHAWFTSE